MAAGGSVVHETVLRFQDVESVFGAFAGRMARVNLP